MRILRPLSLTTALVLAGMSSAVMATIVTADTAQADVTPTVAGTAWLGGNGVPACPPSTDPSCGGQPHVGGVDTNWWQCVELAQRLYYRRGWYTANGGVFAGITSAYQIYDNASSLGMTRQANGAISAVMPGDMIVHTSADGGGSGHVAVVDRVSGSTVYAAEQNFNNTADIGTYTLSGTTLSRGSMHIAGIVHSPNNPNQPGSGGGVQGMTYLGRDNLTHGMRMYPNQYILSTDARWVLTLQGDGNLVLYGPGYIPEWSSGTGGRSVDSLLVQDDGNVVIYGTGSQGALWSTGTVGTQSPSFKVQEDGNVVVYDGGAVAHWSIGARGTPTGGVYVGSDNRGPDNPWLLANQYLKSADGRYVVYMQGDGNLVLWSPGGRIQWASGGGRTNLSGAIQQGDGNLVIYATPIWASNATGSGTFDLKIQNDGNLVTYNTDTGGAIWATHTDGKL